MTQPLWLSRLFGSRSVEFCRVLGASLSVSENVELIEYLMFLHDRNCLMTWWFSGLFVKIVIENRLFTNAYINYNLQVNRKFLSHLSG